MMASECRRIALLAGVHSETLGSRGLSFGPPHPTWNQLSRMHSSYWGWWLTVEYGKFVLFGLLCMIQINYKKSKIRPPTPESAIQF